MNTDGTGFRTCKECHKTESLWNHTTTDHKEGEQLEDRRSVGASSCNYGDGTDRRVQSLMFMMMIFEFYILTLYILRPLAGYTLYDHKTNDYIRRELRITGILDKIDEYRQNWLSHLQRMPQNWIPMKSYHNRPQGRRTIGRPKKSWREQL